MITPSALSTYRFCSAFVDAATGNLWLTEPVPYTYREIEDTIPHVAVEGDSYESIAALYYSALPESPQLWRAIAEFQPVIPADGTIPPAVGSTVFVPSIRTVLEEIFSEARRADYEA